VGGASEQQRAIEELARAVRPGGLVLVHEISTINPLHRLYMSYLFPLWRQIDLGTEHWLDPLHLPPSPSLTLRSVRQYTFLPDFTPGWLYRWLEGVEAWLERSSLAGYAAHFTAVYVRRPAAIEQASPRRPAALELVAAG
jgi:hypothetical protein